MPFCTTVFDGICDDENNNNCKTISVLRNKRESLHSIRVDSSNFGKAEKVIQSKKKKTFSMHITSYSTVLCCTAVYTVYLMKLLKIY